MPSASPIAVIMLTMKNDSGDLTDHRRDRDGDDDRHDRDAHWDKRCDHSTEDEEQHDQRGWQPELQLTLLQV